LHLSHWVIWSVPLIADELGLSASELGVAISVLFFSAVLFQIPVGMLLDRFDPRWVYGGCLFISAAGALVFSIADGVALLALGRGLIAVAVASSLVASFKVYASWFPPEKLPLVNGLSIAAGGLGLMAGTTPVAFALEVFDWREIHVGLAALLAVCLLLVTIVTPARPAGQLQPVGPPPGFGRILGSLEFWRAAPLIMAVMGCFATMAQLWAGPWMRDVAGMSETATANKLLVLAGAMTLAGLMTGWLSGLAGRIGATPLGLAAGTTFVFLLVLGLIWLQWTPNQLFVMAIWALFGFFGALIFVIYAGLAARFPKPLIGRLNACLTLSWMLSAFLLQSGYGFVLDAFPVTETNYSPEGHRAAALLLITVTGAALVWYLASRRFFRAEAPAE
jgi:predicted MFS family arabinose efflux permease